MLRIIVLLPVIISFLVYGCADKEKKSKNEERQKAKEMLSANRCLTCHHAEETINGPSYRDIAKRYEGRPDTIVSYLAKKVINGGSGEWGEIFMTPNPKVPQQDAEAMVRYILSLGNR